MKITCFLVVLFFFCGVSGQDFDLSSQGKITIKVSNIRNDSGQIYLFLYNYENQYPKTPYIFYRVSKRNIEDGSLEFEIPIDLYYGKYALTLIDDENSNNTLDKKLGVPVEGYGFSNNEKPVFFYLPRYGELLFDLSVPEITLGIEVQYLFN